MNISCYEQDQVLLCECVFLTVRSQTQKLAEGGGRHDHYQNLSHLIYHARHHFALVSSSQEGPSEKRRLDIGENSA